MNYREILKKFNFILNHLHSFLQNKDNDNVIYKIKNKAISFMAKINKLIDKIIEEKNVIIDRDPAIKETKEILLYPSFRAMIYYRIAHKIYNDGHYFIARLISQIAAHRTGIEIHPGATIGKDFFIDHGSGVIIGETTVIGDNVTLYQGVTLGGTGKDKGKRHPNIEDDVMIGSGAKVLGPLTIGKGSKIGAGSVVLHSCPPYCTVVGVPGRIVRNNDEVNPNVTLDQIHLPDPVLQDILTLKDQVEELKKCQEQIKNQQK